VLRSPAGTTDEGSGAAVTTLRKHTGPVKGLEFNVSSPNLLASGSTDGDLIIWDVAQPSAPASYQLVRRWVCCSLNVNAH
jgi:protein transport protein SEC31